MTDIPNTVGWRGNLHVPQHRLLRKTTLCSAPDLSEADADSDKSSKVGCVRYLLESLRCNTVDKLLGVRRCTVWNVAVVDKFLAHDALDLPPLACRVTKQNQNIPGCDDWEIDVVFREKTENFQKTTKVLITLMQALASNRTVEVLRLQAPQCPNCLWKELIRSLKTNTSLRHLTLTFASRIHLFWPHLTTRWRRVNKKMSEAVLRSGGLQTLLLRHNVQTCMDRMVRPFLHTKEAQCPRECAVAVATHLSQVCRCNTSAGTREGFKSATFRLWLLSYFLTTAANKKMKDKNLHSASLQALHVKYVCWDEIRSNVLRYSRLGEALRANRRVAVVAKQLSQVCRLETISGPPQGFKSATFRWWLLSHFLSKGMLPKLWQSRILCGSAQAYAVLSDPVPPIAHWFDFDHRDDMNLDAETDSDSEGLVLA